MYKILKNDDFNLRGEVGELIAKNEIPGSFRTKETRRAYLLYLNKNRKLDKKLTNFLYENWFAIDLVLFEKDGNNIIQKITIYEVKTRKYFFGKLNNLFYKEKVTKNFLRMCREALGLGITVKHVQINFFDDWKYGVKIKRFSSDNFCLDKRKHHRKLA